MQVRCIKTNGFSLTVGKVYDVIDIKDGEYYTIINDKCFEYDYSIRMFEEVKEEIKNCKNCKDCKHYLGGTSCSIHRYPNMIISTKNHNCCDFENKKIKKEEVKKEEIRSHVAKGVSKCYRPDKKVLEQSGHYKGDVEPFDVYKSMGIHEQFVIGNIIKYAMRAGKKAGQKNNDIKKIFDYALELCLYTGITEKEIIEILEDRLGYYGKVKDND